MMEIIKLTSAQRREYEKRESALILKNPWHDELAEESGLLSCYICDTITEIMHLRAEKEPEIQLNCINPQFEIFMGLFNALMKVRNGENFSKLLQFAEKYTQSTIKVCRWADYVPDIRVVDTLTECFSWLHRYCGLE